MKIENGKEYSIKNDGSIIKIEGLWFEVAGKSWKVSNGNPACLVFAMRTVKDGISLLEMTDDKVYYGKISNSGVLVCECELEEIK